MTITLRFTHVMADTSYANRSRHSNSGSTAIDSSEHTARPSSMSIAYARLREKRERHCLSSETELAYLSAEGGARASSNFYDSKRIDHSLLPFNRRLINCCQQQLENNRIAYLLLFAIECILFAGSAGGSPASVLARS